MDFIDTLPTIVLSVHLLPEDQIAFSYCNQRVMQYFGVTSSQVMQDANFFFNRLSPTDKEYFQSRIKEAIRNQQSIEFEFEVSQDGRFSSWMLAQFSPSQQSEHGNTLSGICTDITENHLTKMCAIKSADYFMYLQDQISDLFYYKDTNSVFIGGNRAWVEFHGYDSISDLLGKSDQDSLSLSAEDKRKILEEEKDMMRTGTSKQAREKIVSKNGDTRYYESKKTPLYDSQHNCLGLVGITRDITAQIQAEILLEKSKTDAEQAVQAKSSFLAVMSHEIRTPMNGVIGCASLLSEMNLSEEQSQLVNTIQTCGESLLVLINDILDYSKIEAGKINLESNPFQLRLLIEDCIELFSKDVSTKQLEINYFIESDVPLTLNGDANRIRQIINNLVGNAVKFTEKGEVFVEVSLTTIDKSKNSCGLLITVRDTGIGISEANQEHLFKAFTQADSSITRKFGGTGLGLVICKKIIEQMGGDIWFKSSLGVGTTFYLTLVFNFEINEHDGRLPESNAKLEGLRVLIVDDNSTNRKVLANTVMQWGMIPAAFDSPENTMENLQFGHQYDLVLLDFCMPKTNGCDLAAQIKKLPNMFDKPIIMLSSATASKSELHHIEACLLKPVRNSILQKTIVQTLSLINAKDELKLKALEPVIIKETRILIAEDNTVNQMVISMMLKKLGYTNFSCVADGHEAVEQCKAIDFDIIFMDIQMLEMDGYTAAKLIRANGSQPDRPWIIALTAGAQKEDSDRAFASGMNAFTTKPIQIEGLKAVLANAENSLAMKNL